MATINKLKKSLDETKDIIGQTIKIGDRVAYSRTSRNGFNAKTHTGIVMRITEKSVWVLPDAPFKNDRCGKKIEVTNGKPKYIKTDTSWGWTRNPKFQHIGWDVSPVHDWYCRRSDSVIRIQKNMVM